MKPARLHGMKRCRTFHCDVMFMPTAGGMRCIKRNTGSAWLIQYQVSAVPANRARSNCCKQRCLDSALPVSARCIQQAAPASRQTGMALPHPHWTHESSGLLLSSMRTSCQECSRRLTRSNKQNPCWWCQDALQVCQDSAPLGVLFSSWSVHDNFHDEEVRQTRRTTSTMRPVTSTRPASWRVFIRLYLGASGVLQLGQEAVSLLCRHGTPEAVPVNA